MINTVDYGSTGKIMLQLKEVAEKHGFSVETYSRKWFNSKQKNGHHYFGFLLENLFHRIVSPVVGCESIFSFWGTFSLCRSLSKNKPDIIHLHNLHGHYFCFPLLFHFIKKNHISVIWTLHDCWSFTGRCPHFVMAKCNRWKNGCHDCPYPKKYYPQSYIDTSRLMWNMKKKYFTGIKHCILVTPSQWLGNLAMQSYFKDYPVKVINSGIDLSVFKPTENDFREKHGLANKKIVLGVAFGWGIRKGLDVFIELANCLPDDYRIVLVGTDDNVDKKLPSNIISIHRTQNQNELAEIYTAADVFANPTREEVLGLVNVEALACGTPVVTFRTGGSPECIDETCGSVVECNDVDAMEFEIRRICEEKPYSVDNCLKRARAFDMNDRFEEYVELYKRFNRK